MNLIYFMLDGKQIHIHDSPGEKIVPVPQINSFVHIVFRQIPRERWYKVQNVVYEYEHFPASENRQLCLETHVIVYLRRLRPGELGNLDEPSGYSYTGNEPNEQ